MRMEFKVSAFAGGWRVQRGSTGVLTYRDVEAAARAAESLARGAAAKGEKGVVRILRDGCAPEVRIFAPEVPAGRPRVRYDPERDWRNLSQAG